MPPKPTPDVVHAETVNDDAIPNDKALQDAATRGQGLTGYETLTPWETMKKFKACTAYVFIAAIAAGADGYQIGFVHSSLHILTGQTQP
jgi:NADH:ubiquinone oxidoreductase subunit F (NADH-binding)